MPETKNLQALIDAEELKGYRETRAFSEWMEAATAEQVQLQERFNTLETEKKQKQQDFGQSETTRRATIDAWKRQLEG